MGAQASVNRLIIELRSDEPAVREMAARSRSRRRGPDPLRCQVRADFAHSLEILSCTN
jgi:hypothetical protein